MRHPGATREDLRRLAMWLTVEEPQLRAVIDEALDTVQAVASGAFWAELNRLYATISQINQTIVHARDTDDLFREICHVAIDHGQFRMAWIGILDAANGLVKPVVFAGEEQGYLKDLKIKYEDNIHDLQQKLDLI